MEFAAVEAINQVEKCNDNVLGIIPDNAPTCGDDAIATVMDTKKGYVLCDESNH